jgi:hypothetical protein
MPDVSRTTRFSFKPYLWLINFVGLIVPRRLRSDWRQEWEAELRYREALLADWEKLNWRARCELLRRSLGAFFDALWPQRLRWEDDMIQDLRYGVRMLLNRPGFSVSAIVALAVGIGPITGCGFCSALHPGASRDEDRSHNGASERVSLSILDFGFVHRKTEVGATF